MELETSLEAPLNHPCYSGHFPGNPVVPGVLLLELVIGALARGAPRSIDSVKFLSALRPGDAFTLRFTSGTERVTFRCERAGQPVAEGALTFGSRR